MGYKTGQSRCLIEAADREWDMELPNPIPLTTLAPILQLRNVSAGFRTNIIGESEPTSTTSSSPTKPTTTETTNNNNNNNNNSSTITTTTTTTTTKKMKVLGSNKNNKKLSSETNSNSTTNTPSDVTKILDSITFDLEQNTKIAIVGKNGCGKR